MPSELEERLVRLAELVPEPPEDARNRARSAVLEAFRPPTGAQRGSPVRAALRRPLRLIAPVAAAAAVVGLLAVLLIATPDDDPVAGGADLRPDVSALAEVIECDESRLRVPCVGGAQAARRADPALADAPWLYRGPDGALPRYSESAPRPSLVFPPGTTYAEAVDALVVSVTLTGGLPSGSSLAPPLPEGVVLREPASATEGLAIDLRAPLGYVPDGIVSSPTYAGEEPAAGSGETVWPPDTRIAIPTLPACMVATGRTQPPECGPADQPVLRGDGADIRVLPAVPWSRSSSDAPSLTPPDSRTALPGLRLPVLQRARGEKPGGELALDDLRGGVVVVSLFASWCEPCAGQAGLVRDLARRYAGDDTGVAVIGIAVNDRDDRVLAFLQAEGLTITTVSDTQGTAQSALGAPAVPETFLIDRQGRIALRIAGQVVEPETLSAPIEQLLMESP